MFNSHGIQAVTDGPCKRDLEMEAKYLKKRIDRDSTMYHATKEFLMGGPDLSREDGKVLYAIVGALSISVPKMEKDYNNILQKMEEEKSR